MFEASSSTKKDKEPKIKLQDLAFYFDAQARDRLDFGQLSFRNGQILWLREKLLKVPTEQFEPTIHSIHALIKSQDNSSTNASSKNSNRSPQERSQQALTLFESTKKDLENMETFFDQA